MMSDEPSHPLVAFAVSVVTVVLGVAYYALLVAVPLVVLYGLVRFVKWAWQ